MTARARFALGVLAGLVLLQGAWILTMPPFRGIDEFDHAYLATGVASGQWRLSEPAADGRGLEVVVPGSLVEAASAQCASLPYTGPDNCFPIDDLPDGMVTIATAAGGYHPAYYALIGTVASPFAGAGADYAMRVASALLCALGVAAAAYALVLGNRGRWARLGFLVALTPVLVYSTTLPAPNGIEMVAGLCLWTSLLSLLSRRLKPAHDLPLLGAATSAACVLATVRFLGPMWLGLIVVTVVGLAGGRATLDLVRRRPRAMATCSVLVLAAVAGSVWWSARAGLLGTSEHREELPQTIDVDLGAQPFVWLFQVVAAFPRRADAAPPIVYALYLAVFLALLVAAFAKARGRALLTLAAASAVVVLLPVAITLATADSQGVIWQGRYALPFAVGLPIVAGLVLDNARWAPAGGRRTVLAACALLGLAHGWSVVSVLVREQGNPVSAADPAWLDPPAAVVLALVVGSWCVLATAASRDAPLVADEAGDLSPVLGSHGTRRPGG